MEMDEVNSATFSNGFQEKPCSIMKAWVVAVGNVDLCHVVTV